MWQERLGELLLYRQRHGDSSPLQSSRPCNSEAPDAQADRARALGRWVGQQRHLYHSGSLKQSRVDQLLAAGFLFRRADLEWERHFQAFLRTRDGGGGGAGACVGEGREQCEVAVDWWSDAHVSMLANAEQVTQQKGAIAGVQIASKTGTAEHGTDPRNTPPHAWYIAFAPAQAPKVAVAVLVENGGNHLSATGGALAAPIGRATIAAALREGA